MTIEATVDQIIQEALNSASQAQIDADAAADKAIQYASTIAIPDTPPELYEPNPVALTPPDWNPEIFYNDAQTTREEAQQLFQDKIEEWLNTYCPDLTNKLLVLYNWICNAIENGGTGVNTCVEQAMWDRARSREDRLSERTVYEASARVTAMGWDLPTGALATRQMRAVQDNVNRDSTLSRDIMIKMWELEQSNVRFAVQQGVSMRHHIFQEAIQYANILLKTYEMSPYEQQLLYQATVSFYNQLMAYYRQLQASEELLLKHSAMDVDRTMAMNRMGVAAISDQASRATNAAGHAAKVYGSIAASARGAINTMASMVAQETSEA